MEAGLRGKVIVVSGGTKGVGKSVVLAAAAQGAKVVIGGRDTGAAEELLAAAGRLGGDGLFVHTELTDPASCENLLERAEDTFGRVDGFVNYAGVLPAGQLTDITPEEFQFVFSRNIQAAMFCCKAAVRSMLRSGGGSIVLVGSAHAYGGEKDRAIYACSKGALLTLTRHIAANYAPDQIRANWITMGWVATEGELALRKRENREEGWLERTASACIPMGRLLTVEDHVPGILYLLSDQSSMVTGTELQITGGFIP